MHTATAFPGALQMSSTCMHTWQSAPVTTVRASSCCSPPLTRTNSPGSSRLSAAATPASAMRARKPGSSARSAAEHTRTPCSGSLQRCTAH
jgi:hypothetical protein